MIEIDGSYGEGGGQIVRAAMAYSCLTGQPTRIFNIRAKRSNPGLRKQHATAIKVLANLFKAEVEGVSVGSKEVTFKPGSEVRSGNFTFEIGSAGSITLVLQSVTFALIGRKCKITLTIKGGTDVPFSPTFDYFKHCYLALLSRFGYEASAEVARRGYYPEGGGEVKFTFRKHEPQPILMNDCEEDLKVFRVLASASSNLQKGRVCERTINSAIHHILKNFGEVKVETCRHYSQTRSTGAALCIVGSGGERMIGVDLLGKRGLPSEEIGKRCVELIKNESKSGACVDFHLADHLVLFLATCGGEIKTSHITEHTKTMVWLANRFMDGCLKIEGNLIKSLNKG